MNMKNIYEKRKNNSLLNTSYPLRPEDWKTFIRDETLQFDEGDMCFYIHIPFCKKICSFCEYSKILLPDSESQFKYLNVLRNDVLSFIRDHKNIKLKGFDIGGGTPTALVDENFSLLLDIYDEVLSLVEVANDFEPSIEATFDTINQFKIERIAKSNIRRVSLGLQSTSDDVLLKNNRDNVDYSVIEETIRNLHKAGIRKVNLDFMYGIKGQTEDSIRKDLNLIGKILPQQLTVYELRTNMINILPYKNSEELFGEYELLYESLRKMGYFARFGQNTFSLDSSDFGVSSYLRNRMLKGIQYKGFGISAQSMSRYGVSYNKGKRLCEIRQSLNCNTFEEKFSYFLPKTEILSKFIAISGYSGSINLNIASEIYGANVADLFNNEISFLIQEELITLENNIIYITKKGFKFYGAVFSLLYHREKMG